MTSDIRILPPVEDGPSVLGGLKSMLTGGWQGMMSNLANKAPKFPPLEVLPCANVNVEKYVVCEKPGWYLTVPRHGDSVQVQFDLDTNVWRAQECQKVHWATHKLDCKDYIRSGSWQPGWIVEGRQPRFLLRTQMSTAGEFASRFEDRLSLGSSLWGNVPAMDIVNLPNNEKDLKIDLSLAFAASGDIRNVIATVNALGSDYSGELNIVLNDINPHIVSRNIALLLVLGTIPDEVLAADIALHFWYSVFLPMEYRFRILSMMSTLLKKGSSSGPIITPLGPRSSMTCLVSADTRRLLMENAGPVMSPDQAQIEYKRVRKAPTRVDFCDRMYMGLRPSHRLAFLEYRRFGIILPFGALNAHCNVPNSSLFANGVWLQTDFADPLESWDMDEVFSAGKAHGAQPEDVYGCLYFYLSDQLRAFARRLRQLRMSFHVFDAEACALAQGIVQGRFAEYGVLPTVRFDRIDVSNIMDPNYAGIRSVIDTWGSLLAKTANAAVTGYFMNWVAFTEKGQVADAGPSVLRETMELMKRSNKLRLNADPTVAVFLAMADMDAFFDNSKAFSEFLRNRGVADIKLRLRTTHKIIPHRLKTAIDAKPDALPEFASEETWYRYTRLINRTWTERYVEFAHSKT